MNIADWIIVSIVAISCLISVWRGFVKEALSLVIWAAAFLFAMLFYPNMEILLSEWISQPSLLRLAGFGSIFFSVLIAGSLISAIISQLIKVTGLSGTDRMLGIIFGFVRGVVFLLSAIMLAPKLVPIEQDTWYQDSLLIPQLLLLEDWSLAVTQELYSFFGELMSSKAAEELVK